MDLSAAHVVLGGGIGSRLPPAAPIRAPLAGREHEGRLAQGQLAVAGTAVALPTGQLEVMETSYIPPVKKKVKRY